MTNPIIVPSDGKANVTITKPDGSTESFQLAAPKGNGALVLQPVDTTTGVQHWLMLASSSLALALIAGIGGVFLWRLAKGQINLTGLIDEDTGAKASLSRFQALVFTFVVAIGIILILFETKKFPEEIPWSLLVLLGGSLGTYLLSKKIGQDSPPPEPTSGQDSAAPQRVNVN